MGATLFFLFLDLQMKNYMLPFLIFLWGVLFSNSAFAQAAPFTPAISAPSQIPSWAKQIPDYAIAPLCYADDQGFPVVKVRLNNNKDTWFIIDLASQLSSVTRATARILEIAPVSVGKPPDNYEYIPLGSVRFDKVDYHGDFVVRDVDFGTVDGEPIGGFIGTNLLRKRAVLLDFEKNQFVYFLSGHLSESQLQALGFKADQSVAAIPDAEAYGWTVPAQMVLNKKPKTARLQVSTSSYHTLVAGDAKTKAPLVTYRKSGGKQDKSSLPSIKPILFR